MLNDKSAKQGITMSHVATQDVFYVNRLYGLRVSPLIAHSK